MQIEALLESGELKSRAVTQVANTGVSSAASIWIWLNMVDGIDRHDWLAYLIPKFRGGGRLAEIDPTALVELEAEYLRPDALSWAECVAHAKARAAQRGVRLPHSRTLKRHIERKYNRAIIAVMRDENI